MDVHGDNLICLSVVPPLNFAERPLKTDLLIARHVTTNGGIATKKLNRARQSEHAIIYTGSKPPKPPRDERHLRKTAIQATIVKKPYVLHELSRVDYGTEVRVEHTDELTHLGKVTSVGILLKEWKKVRGDTGSSTQKAATPETEDAAGSHAPQLQPSSTVIGPCGTGFVAEADAEEEAPPPQQAVIRPDSPAPPAQADQSIANLKPKEVIIKGGCMVRLSKNPKSKRLQPDSKIPLSGHSNRLYLANTSPASSNEVSKLPRTVRQRNARERKSISTAPTQQTRRPSQSLKSKAQNNSLSSDTMVRADTLTETIEAAVSRALAERDSNRQKAASAEEVIKQTAIHSQVNSHYNVFQARPMDNGPPPPYDVMEFEEAPWLLRSQRRTKEPEPRTADRSSSDEPASNVPPRAPTPPSSGIESPVQDNHGESDVSEYGPEDEQQPIEQQMSDWRVHQALNSYLKPRRIGTGRGSSSSQAESSHIEPQQQQERMQFLFFNSDGQQFCRTGRLDTAADCNFISPRAAREIAHSYHKYRGGLFKVANGEVERPEWQIFTSWTIKNDDNTFWHDRFIVFNNLPCDVIIGKETLQKNDIVHLNPKFGEVFVIQLTSSESK